MTDNLLDLTPLLARATEPKKHALRGQALRAHEQSARLRALRVALEVARDDADSAAGWEPDEHRERSLLVIKAAMESALVVMLVLDNEPEKKP